jgi:hypothetical protein
MPPIAEGACHLTNSQMQKPSEKADWLSFFLHFAFGAIVGCAFGFYTILQQKTWYMVTKRTDPPLSFRNIIHRSGNRSVNG